MGKAVWPIGGQRNGFERAHNTLSRSEPDL
jgi:hypothetical protein